MFFLRSPKEKKILTKEIMVVCFISVEAQVFLGRQFFLLWALHELVPDC